MKGQPFSKGEAIKFGWNTFKGNFGFFILLYLASGLLLFIPGLIASLAAVINPFLGIVFHAADVAISFLVMLGIVKISLNFCDGLQPRVIDLVSQYRLFFKFLLGLILYWIIIYGGMLLLIIPGIIWGLKFWFFDYFIVDFGSGPVESLKKSSAITKGAKWDLFIFFLLLAFLNLLGVLLLLVGVFVTVPVSLVAIAYVYRCLVNRQEHLRSAEAVQE